MRGQSTQGCRPQSSDPAAQIRRRIKRPDLALLDQLLDQTRSHVRQCFQDACRRRVRIDDEHGCDPEGSSCVAAPGMNGHSKCDPREQSDQSQEQSCSHRPWPEAETPRGQGCGLVQGSCVPAEHSYRNPLGGRDLATRSTYAFSLQVKREGFKAKHALSGASRARPAQPAAASSSDRLFRRRAATGSPEA